MLLLGGIAGRSHGDGAVVNIYNCYNKGNVKGSTSAGGIGGIPYGVNWLINCYNSGTIEGTESETYVGGVVGFAYASSHLRNCYNIGKVTSTGTNAPDVIMGRGTLNIDFVDIYFKSSLLQNNVVNKYSATSDAEIGTNGILNKFNTINNTTDTDVSERIAEYTLKSWKIDGNGEFSF